MNERPTRPSRFRFTLRALLVLMLLLALPLRWFGVRLAEAQKQKTAVAALTSGGNYVFYDDGHNNLPPSGDEGYDSSSWLRGILGHDYFRRVDSVQLVDSDADLKYVALLPKVRSLNLTGNNFTDSAVKYLSKMSQLESLDLTHSGISFEAFGRLRKELPDCVIYY